MKLTPKIVSERGGFPVVRKKMKQWSMRITAYAQRLLDGLNRIDWPQPLIDSQTNWIGRSEGAMVSFNVEGHDEKIEVFTTRPDTIFGVSFMTLAPEHDLVLKIVTDEQRGVITEYIDATSKRSERDRMSDVKTISGVFTGAFVEHPLREPTFLFGLAIMCWQVMVLVLLWPFHVVIKEIMILRNISVWRYQIFLRMLIFPWLHAKIKML